MAWAAAALVCAAALLLAPGCGAFNLETRLPIYKVGRMPGAYFGYSVAQHLDGAHHLVTQHGR